jgi:hypothetical protein
MEKRKRYRSKPMMKGIKDGRREGEGFGRWKGGGSLSN